MYCSLFRYEQKGFAALVQHEHLWEQDQSRSLSKAQAGSRKEDAPRKIKSICCECLESGFRRAGRSSWCLLRSNAVRSKRPGIRSAVSIVRSDSSPDPSLRGSTIQLKRRRGDRSLTDFDQISVWVAHVATLLGLMNLWLGDETCTARTPEFIATLNIDDAEIEKRA